MKTVHEVSGLTGISIRTLQYYDNIGLLKPAKYTRSGYRMYGIEELKKLQEIMLLKELEFSLKDISEILDNPDLDRSKTLDQQIIILKMKKEQLERVISLAEKIKKGGFNMDFRPFDKTKIEEYSREAKKNWGNTPEYIEYEERSRNRSIKDQETIARNMMDIFEEFGYIKGGIPDSAAAIELVKTLQNHISKNYYNCTDEILSNLGEMYAYDNEFTKNIDNAGGEGTAEFVNRAIKAYLVNKNS